MPARAAVYYSAIALFAASCLEGCGGALQGVQEPLASTAYPSETTALLSTYEIRDEDADTDEADVDTEKDDTDTDDKKKRGVKGCGYSKALPRVRSKKRRCWRCRADLWVVLGT